MRQAACADWRLHGIVPETAEKFLQIFLRLVLGTFCLLFNTYGKIRLKGMPFSRIQVNISAFLS